MPSSTEHENLLTPGQVAALFFVDAKTVTRWARAGKLTSIRTLGGHRRYRESEVLALRQPAPEPDRDPLSAPVHTLWPRGVTGPAAAVRNRLQKSGVPTVGALTALSAAHLDDLGLRPPQVDEVRLVLARKGLALRGEVLGKVA